MTAPHRRRLLATLASSLLAAPAALAAPRSRSWQDADPDTLAGGGYDDVPYGRRRRVRDSFFDPPEPEPESPFAPYNRPPAYGQDPYAPRRQARPALEPGWGGTYDYARIYGAVGGEPFPIPAFNYTRINPEFLRREVEYRGREEPGAIVVDPRARHLYFVLGGGRAMRYGVGVGRQGFAWSGLATVNSKQAWPDWYPPKEMIERQPALARSLSELRSGIGMAGGPRNPLGARAMYLWQNNKDTLYRIHGTVEPWTIGSSVSSGCIRMVNQDAIDLYERVPVGARVSVLG